ncbi:unnamed protein product [Choristocarpus tenellus]
MQDTGESEDPVKWSTRSVAQSIAAFFLAGICEIGGGWLVWQSLRERRPWWYAVLGSLTLVLYGFVPPTFLPTSASAEFGRVFAVYGGVFIAMSYVWGILADGLKIDRGDIAGGVLAFLGVAIAWFYPRN